VAANEDAAAAEEDAGMYDMAGDVSAPEIGG
jgi:hypothetical protein